MFDHLVNRYLITGQLVVQDSALHVGGGYSEADVDMPVVKDARNKPYVPGSSFRGVVRSLVERAMASLAPDRGCVLFDEQYVGNCPTTSQDGRTAVKQLLDRGNTKAAHTLLLARAGQSGSLCDVCRSSVRPMRRPNSKCPTSGPLRTTRTHLISATASPWIAIRARPATSTSSRCRPYSRPRISLWPSSFRSLVKISTPMTSLCSVSPGVDAAFPHRGAKPAWALGAASRPSTRR